jgi:hypothetical protein
MQPNTSTRIARASPTRKATIGRPSSDRPRRSGPDITARGAEADPWRGGEAWAETRTVAAPAMATRGAFIA